VSVNVRSEEEVYEYEYSGGLVLGKKVEEKWGKMR
jgi:hypothetical protein